MKLGYRSAGQGEALVRTLQNTSHEVISLDLIDSDFTNQVGLSPIGIRSNDA